MRPECGGKGELWMRWRMVGDVLWAVACTSERIGAVDVDVCGGRREKERADRKLRSRSSAEPGEIVNGSRLSRMHMYSKHESNKGQGRDHTLHI